MKVRRISWILLNRLERSKNCEDEVARRENLI